MAKAIDARILPSYRGWRNRGWEAILLRRVLINANGLAPYVDLQVLGVWDNWQTNNGRIDLSESQLDVWGSTVAAGWRMAGKQVPVVLFHDWGFDGFPWGEISPDWEGEKPGEAHRGGGKLTVVVPELEAYSVAILPYDQPPAVTLSGRRIVPSWQWVRPARNEFAVRKGGLIPEQCALPGLLQGMLHRHLRNPPTFVVNMARGGSLAVHVRGVAMLGARLQWQVDGRVVQVVDLPDRDGKNDAMAREYDQTFEFAIPPGRHRVTLDNIGGDWACIGWYAFKGETLDP